MFYSYKDFLPNLHVSNGADSRYSQTVPLQLLWGQRKMNVNKRVVKQDFSKESLSERNGIVKR